MNKIHIRDKIHDCTKTTRTAYLIPYNLVAPVDKVKDEGMCIIELMPIKSFLKYPKIVATLKKGKEWTIRGDTWAEDLEVGEMEYSIDFTTI